MTGKSDFKPDCEGRIKGATVSAKDPEAVARSYVDWFGYEVVERGHVSADQAVHWGCPGMEGAAYVVTGPSSGTRAYIRIVENTDMPASPRIKTYGWNAIELTVRDVEELDRQLQASPFEIIGPPAMLDFSDRIYPMQAVGIADELFYLNEVRGNLPAYDLPLARSFVDQIFIMILATPDFQKAIDFYKEALGWEQGNSYFTKYSVINNAFELPPETPHHLSMTCIGRDVNNEVDQYPEGTTVRPRKAGKLVPGIAMVSYAVTSLDAVKASFLSPPRRFDGAPYEGRRSACVLGNVGELIELIEIG